MLLLRQFLLTAVLVAGVQTAISKEFVGFERAEIEIGGSQITIVVGQVIDEGQRVVCTSAIAFPRYLAEADQVRLLHGPTSDALATASGSAESTGRGLMVYLKDSTWITAEDGVIYLISRRGEFLVETMRMDMKGLSLSGALSKAKVEIEKKKAANQALQTTSVTRSGFGKVSISDRQRRGV